MKMKLIAIAVAAGLTAPIAANAAPSVYGHLQVEIADYDDGKKTKADADKGTPGSGYIAEEDNKRGRLGIKGDEDLGGGLSAIYNFEWQVETTQGDVADGTRVGMVGIKGGFGSVMAGSLKTPYKYTGGVKYDPFVTTFMEARSRGGMSGKTADGNITSGAAGHHGFMTDAIAYKNKFGPIELWVAASVDEKGGTKGNDGDYNASVKFDGGNFEAFFATVSYDGVQQSSSFYVDGTDLEQKDVFTKYDYTANKIGGMFKMGPHKIKLQIEATELKKPSSRTYCTTANAACTPTAAVASTSKTEGDFMFLGYELGMGKNVIAVNYGTAEFKDVADVDYLALGVIHKFSKNTRAFVGYSTSETSPKGGGTKTEADVTSLGLRVDF